MVFRSASEPGNIIWETKHIRGKTLYQRLAMVVALISAILFATFGIVIEIKSYTAFLNSRIPFTDCKDLYNIYDETYIRSEAGTDLEKSQKLNSFDVTGVNYLVDNYKFNEATKCFCLNETNWAEGYSNKEIKFWET